MLIGATTENPSFEVNAALLSRAKVVVLSALTRGRPARGARSRARRQRSAAWARRPLDVPDDVRELIAREARGDARRALATLEAAAAIAAPDAGRAARTSTTPAIVEEALQKRTLLYDKAGDEHYGVVSARSSRACAAPIPTRAVYWMARMLEAGEDPLFVLRRMVIFAAEDVGNADPQALVVAVAAMDAFRFVGLPEGLLPMTQAVLYLATAPKTQHGASRPTPPPRPTSTRTARCRCRRTCATPSTPLRKSLGWSAGYQYPHDFEGHYVREEYLPEALRGRRYYQPSDSGQEKAIGDRLRALRDEPRAEAGRTEPAAGQR